MSHTLTVSEELFVQLQHEAQARGLESVEKLLEECHGRKANRRQAAQHIDALRNRLRERYGVMPDSVELLREDRNR